MKISTILFIVTLSMISTANAAGQASVPKPTPTPSTQTFDDIYGLKNTDLTKLGTAPNLFGDDLASRTKAAIRKKDYAAVLAEISERISKNKKDAEALALRGDIYLAQKQTLLARADYDQAIKLSSKTSLYYYKRAMAFQESPGYDLAASDKDINKALELDPNNSGALTEKGYSFNRAKNSADAKTAFSAAARSDPSNVEAFYQLGAIALKENDLKSAVDGFSGAIKADPSYIYSFGARAGVYESLKQFDKAIADYAKLIELFPGDQSGYSGRAYLQVKLKNYALAVKDFTKLIGMPASPDSYYRIRAETYWAWGKYDEARADYDTYLKKNTWDAASIKNYNVLIDTTNAARKTATAMSEVFNPALEAYGKVEDELAPKLKSYRALRDSNLLVKVKGKHPLCAQISTLEAILAKAVAAFDPIQKLYDQGKLKGFSDQIDFAEDRINRIEGTHYMFVRDKETYDCTPAPIYYVE